MAARPAADAGLPAAGRAHWIRDDRGQWLSAALVWLLVVLMIVPEGFAYDSLASAGAPASGSLISRLLWLALLGIATLILLWRAAFGWLLVSSASGLLPGLLLGFVLLVAASIGWSIAPEVTARRLIRVLSIVVVSAVPVLIGWHAARFQNLLRPVITAVLIGSILFGLGWPQLAIHEETSAELAGAWRGLANHKNGFGDIACIGLILWCHAWLAREASALKALSGMALAAACLLLSRSATSLLATVMALGWLWLLLRAPWLMRRHAPQLIVGFVLLLLVYSLALLRLLPGLDLLLSPIGAITGKDMSFTGRTEIWALVSEHIHQQPWFGSGYGAYWTGPVIGTPSYAFIDEMAFYPGSAHNGYLEIVNDLGAVGLLLLFGYLLAYLRQALRLMRLDRPQGALYLALFVQQAITNLSESRWLSALSVDFVIMSLATAGLARTLFDQRLQHDSAVPAAPDTDSGPNPDAWLSARP